MDSRCVIFEPGQADQFIFTPLAEGEAQYQEEQEEEKKSKDQMSLARVSTVPFPTLPDVCLPILQQCLKKFTTCPLCNKDKSSEWKCHRCGNSIWECGKCGPPYMTMADSFTFTGVRMMQCPDCSDLSMII